MTTHSPQFFPSFHSTPWNFFLLVAVKICLTVKISTIKAFRIGFAWTMRKKISKRQFNEKKSLQFSNHFVASRCKLRFLQSLSHDEQFSARRLTHIQQRVVAATEARPFQLTLLNLLITSHFASILHASSNSTKLRRMFGRAKRH